MNEQDVRKIVQDENQKNYRSGSPMIPPHTHNGNDNLQIQESNLVHNNKYGVSFSVTEGDGEITIANGVLNPTAVYFSGIARTPVSGTATVKCQLTGFTQLGKCFFTNGVQLVPQLSNTINNNTCTTFTDQGVLSGLHIWTPNVIVDDNYFVVAKNSSGTIVASITVKSYTNTSITFTETCMPGWTIIGGLTII